MDKTIEERAMAASERYVERKGFTVLDTFDDYFVADEDGTLHIIFVRVANSELPKEAITRKYAEKIAANYLASHDVALGQLLFDIISIAVFLNNGKDDRALLRFHSDALEEPKVD